jgi:hypothetical protein
MRIALMMNSRAEGIPTSIQCKMFYLLICYLKIETLIFGYKREQVTGC